uniref:Ral guanine nucleotide dissociation stimulator like 2 n=1 Tax=Pelusios castaneus TaxID=367368 RepID=A0A8C8SMR0_9SAUR
GDSNTLVTFLPPQPPVTLTEEVLGGVQGTIQASSDALSPQALGGSGSQARSLKAGSLVRLVRHLLEAQALGDATYVPAFLVTYRAFARDTHVVCLPPSAPIPVPPPSHLPPTQITSSVCPVPHSPSSPPRAFSSVLCSWLDRYPEDFGGTLDPSLMERLGRSLRCALGQGSEAERRLLALRGQPPLPPCLPDPSPRGGECWRGGEQVPEESGGQAAAPVTLTLQALFLRVVPYQCLGSLWSQRDKKGRERDCPSVRATVRQFNRLVGAVICSCLAGRDLRPQQRARILEKWIHVAEECRALRNFSSLCAIVSALQSSPVHRLKRTWDETARDVLRSYEELSAICSEQDNYSLSRQLLFQEGTSKPTGADPAPRRQARRLQEQRPVGVVPYLGTFLRDLVMLDAAMKDELENGYINFEKRRKEFEVLAQLRLLQSMCRNYSLQPSPPFQRWLRALRPISETESHSLSYKIEPPGEAPSPQRPPKPTVVITHSPSHPLMRGGPRGGGGRGLPPALHPFTPLLYLQHVKWPSVSALDTASEDSAPSPGGLSLPAPTAGGFFRGHRRSASCGSAFPAPPSSSSDCCIIRARMELHNGSLYKSILVTSQDKTPSVIATVLEKHGQERGAAPQFQLVQLLPDGKELTFPPTANVFYAMNGSSLDFVLRPKGPVEPPLPPNITPRRPELSATFPKIKVTGHKLARALF